MGFVCPEIICLMGRSRRDVAGKVGGKTDLGVVLFIAEWVRYKSDKTAALM